MEEDTAILTIGLRVSPRPRHALAFDYRDMRSLIANENPCMTKCLVHLLRVLWENDEAS